MYLRGLLILIAISAAVSAQGPVAHYPFDGNANDAIGTRHGTVVGANLTTDRFGNANSAFDFDGVDDYIVAAADGLPTGERTTSLWFQADSVASEPVLLGYGGDGSTGSSWWQAINCCSRAAYTLGLHWPGAPILSYFYNEEPLGAWHHFAATTDSTGSKIYVDGCLVVSNTHFVNNTFVVGKDLSFGVDVDGNGIAPFSNSDVGYFDGRIDDIRIYDYALSAAALRGLGGFTATEMVRLGTPSNPDAFHPGVTTGPLIGQAWDPAIDHTTFAPAAILDFVGISVQGSANLTTAMGTLLILPPFENPIIFNGSPGTPFAIPIPNDCSFVGASVWTQGGSVSPGPVIELANALDLVLGNV